MKCPTKLKTPLINFTTSRKQKRFSESGTSKQLKIIHFKKNPKSHLNKNPKNFFHSGNPLSPGRPKQSHNTSLPRYLLPYYASKNRALIIVWLFCEIKATEIRREKQSPEPIELLLSSVIFLPISLRGKIYKGGQKEEEDEKKDQPWVAANEFEAEALRERPSPD